MDEPDRPLELTPQAPGAGQAASGQAAAAAFVLAATAMIAAVALKQPWLFALAAALIALGLYWRSAVATAGRTHVGVGSEIASDAILEPGSTVEMGATVESRAIIRSGAVVRMGATVAAGAIIERNAVVSWGADVHAGAVVGEEAIVGAGCDIHAGARVPPRLHVRAGSDFHAAAAPAVPEPADPRALRAEAVCKQVEDELRASPGFVQQFLGGSHETVAQLRRSSGDLLRRERALRAEAEPAALVRLDDERRALQERIAAQPDPQIRASLQGAVQALDEQRRQRALLQLGADRLEAEQTRLVYTLEGLAALFVRVRTGGAEQAPLAELERGAAQLKDELSAIAEALEQVAQRPPDALPRALAEGPPDDLAAGTHEAASGGTRPKSTTNH